MSPLFQKIRHLSILFTIHYSIYCVNEPVHVSYVPLLSSTGNEGVCLFTSIRRHIEANLSPISTQKPVSQKVFTIMAPFTRKLCEPVFMNTPCEFILGSYSLSNFPLRPVADTFHLHLYQTHSQAYLLLSQNHLLQHVL